MSLSQRHVQQCHRSRQRLHRDLGDRRQHRQRQHPRLQGAARGVRRRARAVDLDRAAASPRPVRAARVARHRARSSPRAPSSRRSVRPTSAIEGRGFFVLDGTSRHAAYSRAGHLRLRQRGPAGRPDRHAPCRASASTPTTLELDGPARGHRADHDAGAASAIEPAGHLGEPRQGRQRRPVRSFPSTRRSPNTTSNFQNVITLFDSLGGGHPATMYFTQDRAPTRGHWTATLPPGGHDHRSRGTRRPGRGAGRRHADLRHDRQPDRHDRRSGHVRVRGRCSARTGRGPRLRPASPAVGTGDPTTQFAESSTVNSATQDGFARGHPSEHLDRSGGLHHAGRSRTERRSRSRRWRWRPSRTWRACTRSATTTSSRPATRASR